jgi:aryl-alcohol dehydrogenase-like predicted oxidoreductase
VIAGLPRRPLGSSGMDVSIFSLGSWRTFERIGFDRSLAVMRRAREVGIDFLDDARYDDETGSAPIPSGYSEVLFGELFRANGWRRDEVVVANKLWWEFWPQQSPVDELDASLGRMGLDHVDLIYAMTPPEGLDVAEIVGAMGELIDSGRARAWGVANWSGPAAAEALAETTAQGVDEPCAAQLPYSLVRHEMVDDPAMAAVLASGVALVASYVLAGGTLTGKYGRGGDGRGAHHDDPVMRAGRRAAGPLGQLAEEWGVSATDLAFCFALAHPHLSSILFGATTPEQIDENVASLGVFHSLDGTHLEALAELGRIDV